MARTVALLLNPHSGKGRTVEHAPRLVSAFERRNVACELLVGESRADAVDLARKAVANGVDALVAVGGDGTVNTALQAVGESDTPLGIISMGTGNDSATLLDLPTRDPEGAVDVICRFHQRAVDVGSVVTADGHRQYFLGVLSAGFDALVNERANAMTWPKGTARYILAMLAELRVYRTNDFAMTLDGSPLGGPTALVAVGNGVTYGGGMRVCEGARIDDGLLQLTWVHDGTRSQFLRFFPKVYSGTHIEEDLVTQHAARRVRIEAAGQVAYADGDRMGELPIDIEVHPSGLRVLTV